MTERQQLLAAIRAHPDADTPRAMFADFLQDSDDPENVWLGQFIAAQLSGVPWDGPLLLDKLVGFAALTYPSYGVRIHHAPRQFSHAVTYWRGDHAAGSITYPIFDVNRGFITRCEIPCWRFMETADALFARHPILDVELPDRLPIRVPILGGGYDYSWMSARSPLHYNDPWELPPELFELVEGFDPARNVVGGCDSSIMRAFGTDEAARAALPPVCLKYGRQRAEHWLAHNTP